MRELTLDEKVNLIRSAIQQGARIQVSFYQMPSEEEAKEKMEFFAQAAESEVTSHSSQGTHWLNVECDDRFEITTFYKKARCPQCLETIQ